MKITSAVLLILLLSLITYGQNSIYVSVGTGLSIPMAESEFTDAFNLGFNLHGAGTVIMSRNFGLRGDLQYNRFPYDESNPDFSGSFTATTLKFDLLAGDFSGGSANPYAVFGAGAYFLSASSSSGGLTISSSETDFGIGIGGGVMFKVSPSMSLYGETQYNIIFNDGTAKGYLPLKFGLSFKVQ